MQPLSELISVDAWLKHGPRIRGNSARSGRAYTYITDDGELNLTDDTVRDFNYLELQRMAIIQGRIKIHELETLLLTHVSGRVVGWGVWKPVESHPRTEA